MSEDLAPFEERAELVLDRTFRGMHHVDGKVHQDVGIERWTMNTRQSLCTYDSDLLTRLVLAAHSHCIRASIEPSGPGMLKIVLHNRKGREGRFYERHPTIGQAISAFAGKKAGHCKHCSGPCEKTTPRGCKGPKGEHGQGPALNYKQDKRPQLGGWAPGDYTNRCLQCGDYFIGDKRAGQCADCAYAEQPDPKGYPWANEEGTQGYIAHVGPRGVAGPNDVLDPAEEQRRHQEQCQQAHKRNRQLANRVLAHRDSTEKERKYAREILLSQSKSTAS